MTWLPPQYVEWQDLKFRKGYYIAKFSISILATSGRKEVKETFLLQRLEHTEWDENSTAFSVIWLMLQQFWDLNDKYLQKGTNLKTIQGFKESRLWKTAKENLYHLIKFSLYLLFTVHYLYKEVSCFLPVLYIRIKLSCFYLLIFYFEKFSSWIWHLLFAVSMTLNLSNNNKIYHRVKSKNHLISQLIRKHTTYLNLSW